MFQPNLDNLPSNSEVLARREFERVARLYIDALAEVTRIQDKHIFWPLLPSYWVAQRRANNLKMDYEIAKQQAFHRRSYED